MTHLYLIRHGDYIGEAHGKLVDHGLSPLGVKQAELLRDRLAAPALFSPTGTSPKCLREACPRFIKRS